ncbi:MAG TPA: MoaD/ThiS family protein [Sphingomicrobium sp.]|jgi:molybdopterin converting factor small subunit
MQDEEARLKVVFYGRLTDLIGREVGLDAADCSVAEIRRHLAANHPAAAEALARSRALIGSAVVEDDRRVGAEEELEFLPPVSGG